VVYQGDRDQVSALAKCLADARRGEDRLMRGRRGQRLVFGPQLQRLDRVGDDLIDIVSCRKAAWQVGEGHAERAVGILLHQSKVALHPCTYLIQPASLAMA